MTCLHLDRRPKRVFFGPNRVGAVFGIEDPSRKEPQARCMPRVLRTGCRDGIPPTGDRPWSGARGNRKGNGRLGREHAARDS